MCHADSSRGRIKAYGNIEINGYLVAQDKIKGCGKLKVVGTLEGTELEIYGNLTINGYLYVSFPVTRCPWVVW